MKKRIEESTYIVDLSGAAEDVAFDAVVAVVVPFAALLVVGTACPVPKVKKLTEIVLDIWKVKISN